MNDDTQMSAAPTGLARIDTARVRVTAYWESRPDRQRGIVRTIIVYCVSRLAVWFAAAIAVLIGPERSILEVFVTWDGSWYLKAMTDGYPTSVASAGPHHQAVFSTVPFFPVYPMLGRAASFISPFSDPATLVGVTMLIGAVAAVALWLTADRLVGGAAADRAMVLFCFAPGAVVLSFAYSEGTMLVLSMLALWALWRERWLIAGVAGFFATLSRPNAVVLVACASWAAMWAIHRRRDWWALVPVVLTPLGFASYVVWIGLRTGELDAWFRVQSEAWGERTDWGHHTFTTLQAFFGRSYGYPPVFTIAFGAAVVAIGCWFLWKARLPGVYNVFAVGVIALAWTSAVLGPRPRFVFTAFPLTISAAKYLRRDAFAVAVALFGAGLVSLTILYGVDWPPGGIAPPP